MAIDLLQLLTNAQQVTVEKKRQAVELLKNVLSQAGNTTQSTIQNWQQQPSNQLFNKFIAQPISNVGQALSKQLIYDPETKRIFPSSPVLYPEAAQRFMEDPVAVGLSVTGGVNIKGGLGMVGAEKLAKAKKLPTLTNLQSKIDELTGYQPLGLNWKQESNIRQKYIEMAKEQAPPDVMKQIENLENTIDTLRGTKNIPLKSQPTNQLPSAKGGVGEIPIEGEPAYIKELKTPQQRDFQRMVVVGQNTVKEITDAGLKKSVNRDGTLTIFHGTSKENAKAILDSGKFNEETFFSPLKSKSAFGSEGAISYGKKGEILEIKVDARDINFNGGTGEIEASKGLVRGNDNVWRSPERTDAAQLPLADIGKTKFNSLKADITSKAGYERLNMTGDLPKPINLEMGKLAMAGDKKALSLPKDEFINNGIAYYKTTPEYIKSNEKGWAENVTKNDLAIFYTQSTKQLPIDEAGAKTVGLMDRISTPLAETTIPQVNPLEQLLKPQQTIPSGVKPPPEISISSEATITNFVNKFKEVFPKTKDIRNLQERLYSQERGKRFGAAQAVGVEGEKGFWAEKAKLAGELPKAQYESIRKNFNQNEMDTVFKYVRDYPYLTYGEKLNLREGLSSLFGAKGTTVPTKSQLSLAKEVFGEDFTKTILEKRPFLEKFQDAIGEILSVPRSLMAGGLDMSFGLRQGIFGAYRYPKQWVSSMKDQFKWFRSDEALEASRQQIRSDPDYLLARKGKLAIPEITSGREEQFVGTLAEKIPGIGAMVKATGRAYQGFATKYRFDIFKSLLKTARQTGDFNRPGYVENLAKHINTLTGRGSLGRAEAAAQVASTALFSPRLLASRLNLLNPIYYARLDPAVRKEALKGLFSFIAGTGTILGLSKMAGADVVTDPTNSDFLKIKKGNTRIDIMGGFQQPIVLASRLLTGKLTSSITGKEMILGDEKTYKPTTSADIMMRFFESKEAPVVSFLTSLLKGQTAIGDKFDAGTEIINRVTPMFIGDIYDLWKEGDLEIFPIAGTAAFFGAGAQTYGKQIPNLELTAGGKPTLKLRSVPGLGEDFLNFLTGKQSSNIKPELREGIVKQLLFKQNADYQKEQIKNKIMEDRNSQLKNILGL